MFFKAFATASFGSFIFVKSIALSSWSSSLSCSFEITSPLSASIFASNSSFALNPLISYEYFPLSSSNSTDETSISSSLKAFLNFSTASPIEIANSFSSIPVVAWSTFSLASSFFSSAFSFVEATFSDTAAFVLLAAFFASSFACLAFSPEHADSKRARASADAPYFKFFSIS
ncbi:putative lipoprotein [Anaerococcus hydrogenalis ACS-025-V-Sch4]|uniref:Putative lipoprotein n=1 Tax=Anaerococcus hydrogenalis ACS-025-V-Sch4 TaxID=879306 RepID=F0H163_9FIRM|nr:putative lipoprotein [Anaerococcus hydrogenalis ACS-025-V-Sch4]